MTAAKCRWLFDEYNTNPGSFRVACEVRYSSSEHMSRLLILGTGPLLEPGVTIVGAHGLRTWQLTKPLVDAGHEVLLHTLPIPNAPDQPTPAAGIETRSIDGFTYHAFTTGDEHFATSKLEDLAKEFKPDALVGISTGPASVLTRVSWRAPFWADLYGSAMIEGEVRSQLHGHNAFLPHFWNQESTCLRRGDRFSAVSRRQMYMLHGELAALGRMNRRTFNHPFAVCIPSACNPFHEADASAGGLRGSVVPKDAFVLLWSGGYNVWTDYNALREGVLAAMDRHPELHYVSTGGTIHGHNDLSYPAFEKAVGESRHADRFHLLGWIDAARLPGVMADSDLGLCVDAANHESLFGARTRTVNMMTAGLPVLSSTHAEISDDLDRADCLLSCGAGSARDIADAVSEAVRNPAALKLLAARARDHVRRHLSAKATTRELVAWAMKPDFAPDNAYKLERFPETTNPFLMPGNLLEGKPLRPHVRQPFERPESIVPRAVWRIAGPTGYERLRFLRSLGLPALAGRIHDSQRVQPVGQIDSPAQASHLVLPPSFTGQDGASEHLREMLGQPGIERITIENDGLNPAGLEITVGPLAEEVNTKAILSVRFTVHGDEGLHNRLLKREDAWNNLQRSLFTINAIRNASPIRIEPEAVYPVRLINCRCLAKVESSLFDAYGLCMLFVPTTSLESLSPKNRHKLIRLLYSIRRKRGYADPWSAPAMRLALRSETTESKTPDDLPQAVLSCFRGRLALVIEHQAPVRDGRPSPPAGR